MVVVVAAITPTGCAGGDDIIGQTNDMAQDVWAEPEGFADGSNATVSPRDVACVRPKAEHFVCSAYVQVRDGVALIAEYAVTPCEGNGFRARMRSAPDWLRERMPGRFDSGDCGYVEPSP